jgi:hypothetical protein
MAKPKTRNECDEDRKRFAAHLLLLEVAKPMANRPPKPKPSGRRRAFWAVAALLGSLFLWWAATGGTP